MTKARSLQNRPLLLLLALPALVATAATAQNNLFTQSGFVVRYADTPERHAMLRSLPADRLVRRVKNGKTYYIYADPEGCRCAYVGTPQAYATYQNGGPGMMGYNNVDGGGTSLGAGMQQNLLADPVDGLPGDSDMADFLYPDPQP